MIKKITFAFFIYMIVMVGGAFRINAEVDGILPSVNENIYRILNIFGAPTACSITALGAVGNSATDSTNAINTCIKIATAPAPNAGSGVVYIPPSPSGGCYNSGAINATGKSGLIIRGNGQASCLGVAGSSPTNSNWFDGSGSGCVDIKLQDFKVVSVGSVIPKVVFFFGAQNTGLNTISCVQFDHMYIDAKSTSALVYAYGLANSGGFSGMSCYNSNFFQRNNGPSVAASLRNAALVLDGINSRALASDYITVTTLNPGSDGNSFVNCNFVDWPAGFGGGTQDNNTAVVQVTTGQVRYQGGSMQCTCLALWNLYTNNEGTTASDMVMQAPDGSVTITFFIVFGGGTNGEIGLDELFWSVPKTGGCFICMDVAVGGAGGINDLSVRNPDIGGNTNAAKFILDIGGCTGAPANWIVNSYIQMQAGANDVFSCTSIDAHTSLINPGTISVGVTDNSRHQ